MTAVLDRQAFITSRMMDFFKEDELSTQIGHGRDMWPLALLKELIDNSLDACEKAGVRPEIYVEVGPDTLTVRDNGPGLPAEVLRQSLDYTIRVSDKSYYVSPTRGRLGNALKCVWAAPFVASGQKGRVEVEADGYRHVINVILDRIAHEPRIEHLHERAVVKNGTSITMHWNDVAKLTGFVQRSRFLQRRDVARRLCCI